MVAWPQGRASSYLSGAFYENLVKHAVSLNERAFAALKKSATQIDLYTYLVYRLHRIPKSETVTLKWADLAHHLGNEIKELFKFRQTVRKAWVEVSGVYQQARHSVLFDDLVVRLQHAEEPLTGHLLKHRTGKVEEITLRPKDFAGEGRKDAIKALPKPVRLPQSGTLYDEFGHR